jgi:hypothetical protein
VLVSKRVGDIVCPKPHLSIHHARPQAPVPLGKQQRHLSQARGLVAARLNGAFASLGKAGAREEMADTAIQMCRPRRRLELDNKRLAIEIQEVAMLAQKAEIEVAVMARKALLDAYGKLDDDQEWAFYTRVSKALQGDDFRSRPY